MQFILSLVSSRPTPNPTLMHLFLSIVAFFTVKSHACISFDDNLAVLCSSWYVLFHIHSALTDVRNYKGLHTYAVMGENVLR